MVKIKSLKEAEEFRRIKLEGTRFSEGGLDVFITPEENGVSKIGVQISSKIANSVIRNRVKRRIKEAAKFLEERQAVYVVVVVRKEGLGSDTHKIVNTLKRHPSL